MGNDGRERIVEGCCIHMGAVPLVSGMGRRGEPYEEQYGLYEDRYELYGWDGEGMRA